MEVTENNSKNWLNEIINDWINKQLSVFILVTGRFYLCCLYVLVGWIKGHTAYSGVDSLRLMCLLSCLSFIWTGSITTQRRKRYELMWHLISFAGRHTDIICGSVCGSWDEWLSEEATVALSAKMWSSSHNRMLFQKTGMNSNVSFTFLWLAAFIFSLH